MTKAKKRFINIIYWLAIIIGDFLIFFVLAFLLINYEDTYVSSKGELWSLASMNWAEKINYIGYIGWIVLNIVGVPLFIGWKIYKGIKHRKIKAQKTA